MSAKVGIVERKEAVIARRGHDKSVSVAIDAAVEDAVLSKRTFVATTLETPFCSNQSTLNNT
jgi:hypothetical protein